MLRLRNLRVKTNFLNPIYGEGTSDSFKKLRARIVEEIGIVPMSSCTRFEVRFPGLNPQTKHTNGIQSPQPEMGFGIRSFLFYAKGLYAQRWG